MLVESNKIEFCRVLLQLLDEERLTFRLDDNNQPVFGAKEVAPDVEELICLVDNQVHDSILYWLLLKKLEFRMTFEKGKKNLRWYALESDIRASLQ